jgi:NADPH:quinone reductase-like Zn-dependent oxidoreductase
MENFAKKARTVLFREIGEPDVLKIETIDIPAPGPMEVRVQVKAMGLNRADALYRRGIYLEDPIFPAKIGYEAAGIVEAVGNEVSDVNVGDIVSIIPAFSLHQYATHGELVIVPAYSVEKHPASISFEDAAALWSTYLTAYGLVIDSAKTEKGQYVVLDAASSSVALAAIQVVNAAGAIPIALTTSLSKKEALLEAGAAHVVVTSDQDAAAEIMRITTGSGAHVFLAAVGGPLLVEIISAMAPRGKIYLYGLLNPAPIILPAMEILAKTLSISGFMMGYINNDPALQTAAKAFIYDGLTSGKLKPIVAKTFSFEDFVAAHEYLESNKQVGKIVVTI